MDRAVSTPHGQPLRDATFEADLVSQTHAQTIYRSWVSGCRKRTPRNMTDFTISGSKSASASLHDEVIADLDLEIMEVSDLQLLQ